MKKKPLAIHPLQIHADMLDKHKIGITWSMQTLRE